MLNPQLQNLHKLHGPRLHIQTFKAQPTDKPVPDLTITATKEIKSGPLVDGWEAIWKAQLQAEAVKIVDALVLCLPGGLVSHIYAELAKRNANALAIAWRDFGKEGGER